MPKVSVMVPAYNAQSFIEETLTSILSQDYGDFQIVVSDDASLDATADIIRQYEERYPSRLLAIYNQKNLGITKNCNVALSRCDGEYIVLFAGDDVMLPGKISKQVAFMEANPQLAFSYHAVEIFQSETGEILNVTDQNPSARISNGADVITKMGIPGPMSIMLRRCCLPQSLFDENLSFVSDWMLQFQLSLRGEIGFLEGVWCRYRKYGVNNGKSLAAYEDEFLKVLDSIADEHPEFNEVCNAGRSRYFIGRSFRESDPLVKRKFIKAAYQYGRNPVYRVLEGLTYMPFSKSIFDIIKNIYKKTR